MKTILLILLLFSLTFFTPVNLYSQSEKPVRLLEEWMGVWEGTLDITTSEGKESEVKMQLEISKTDTPGVWKWMVRYGDLILGNYLLRLQNSGKGTFILDENNSMKIDYYYKDNTFFSNFSSQGSLLSTQYKLVNNNIIFEVVTSSMNSANISNDSSDSSELVYSYPIFALQKAVLSKIDY